MALPDDNFDSTALDTQFQDTSNGLDNILLNPAPTSKLDADQYSAEDLDGATESLFGSGNLAHASLQASQTDEAIRSAQTLSINGDMGLSGLQNSGANALGAGNIFSDNGALADTSNGNAPNNARADFQSLDRGSNSGTDFGLPGNGSGNGGNFTASTVGSLGASQLSSDAGSFSSNASSFSLGDGIGGANGSNGLNGTAAQNPNNGTNGTNGANGNNGSNGQNGTGNGNGDTNIDIEIINLGDNLLNIDLGDAGDIINNVLINLNQTVTNVTDFLTEIVNVLGDIITNLDISNILDLDILTEIVTNITDNLTTIINTAITEITNITNNLTNIINNLLGGNGFDGLHLTLDLNLLDTLLTGVDIPLYDILATDLDLDLNLDPTLNLVSNLGDLTGIALIGDALEQLQGTTTALQDTIDGITDIVTNLDLRDLGGSLEDVQAALGNLDELVAAVVPDVTGLVGEVLGELGLDATPLEDITNTVLDPVVAAVGDLLAGDLGNLEDGITTIIDPVTALTEDILDGLGGLGLGLGEGDADGLISQTLDPVLGDVGNVLDDLTGGATGDLTDTLEGTVDQVTDLVDNLTGGLTDGLLGLNNNNQNGADGDIDIGLDLGSGGAPVIDEIVQVALDPIEDLLGDVDIGLDVGLDLLGGGGNNTDNTAGDNDITLDTGIDIVDNTLLADVISDISLDPLEGILGDIDIDLGASVNLLGDMADPFVNDGQGGSGEDTLLAQLGETLEDTVSGVLEGDLDLNNDTLENVSDVVDTLLDETPLNDTIENILGGGALDQDITDGLGDALSLLDNTLPGEGGNLLDDLGDTLLGGDDDLGNWTESIIPEVGGLFDDITGALGGADDILPDPVGTIAEGLGAIPIIPQINLGKIGGGLFG